jgi:hypothetical protein
LSLTLAAIQHINRKPNNKAPPPAAEVPMINFSYVFKSPFPEKEKKK